MLDGTDLRSGAVVLSIGSTRPNLRELDRTTLARTATLLVDHIHSVEFESGDIIDALEHEALGRDQMISMGGWLNNGHVPSSNGGRDVMTFKSVGTIVQDLALAGALLTASGLAGSDLGELCRLKPSPPHEPRRERVSSSMMTPVVTPVFTERGNPCCHPYESMHDRELRCVACGNRMFSSRAEQLLDQGLRCSRCLGDLQLMPSPDSQG